MVRLRVAALVIRDDCILLARHFKDGRTSYLLPGGGLQDGETSHAALARELREEADVECTIGALHYVVEALAPDAVRHIVQFVFATCVNGDVGRSCDPRVVECEWHTVEELRTLTIHPAVGGSIADDLEHMREHDRSQPVACRYLLAPWQD